MFGKGIKLFKLLGFEVRLDLSWIIVAVLITWSLAMGFFPQVRPGLSIGNYWIMGLIGAVGLFLSIILHELAHSLVARRFDIPMRGITLFIFGGVAQMEKEPPSPKSEFFMAIAGPIMTAVLVLIFWALRVLASSLDWPITAVAVLGYLAWINAVVLVFNLIPAFPLDGGRVLRSALWAWKKNIKWATRIASTLGTGFGWLLIAWGVVIALAGNLIGGLWAILIGFFLRGASQVAYHQVFLREVLQGEPVRRFMHSHPVTIPPSATIQQFLDDYVLKFQHKMFPVSDDGKLLGAITLDQIKNLPAEERVRRTVGEFLIPASQENTIEPDRDTIEALSLMNRTQNSRLMVTDHDHLEGILSLKDLQRFLSLKVELESA